MNTVDVPEVKSVFYKPCYQEVSECLDTGLCIDRSFKLLDALSGKVIHQDRYTIVILYDGSKGVAKCMEGDTYSRKKGLRIAYYRALIAHLEKLTKELCHSEE